MARGKQTCKILKEIRRRIAEANDIDFITSECRYKGDCLGTCPKCEAEVRYLEEQLRQRSLAGKAVVLAGISAGMMFLTGCGSPSSDRPQQQTTEGGPSAPVEQAEEADSIIGGEIVDADTLTPVAKEPLNQTKPIGTKKKTVKKKAAKQEAEEEKETAVGKVDESRGVGMIETPPEFQGGNSKISEWITQNMVYPQTALDDKVEGKVTVNFEVQKDGSIGFVKVEKGVREDLDQEAVRLIKSLPRFTPGRIGDRPLEFEYTWSIVFQLPE